MAKKRLERALPARFDESGLSGLPRFLARPRGGQLPTVTAVKLTGPIPIDRKCLLLLTLSSRRPGGDRSGSLPARTAARTGRGPAEAGAEVRAHARGRGRRRDHHPTARPGVRTDDLAHPRPAAKAAGAPARAPAAWRRRERRGARARVRGRDRRRRARRLSRIPPLRRLHLPGRPGFPQPAKPLRLLRRQRGQTRDRRRARPSRPAAPHTRDGAAAAPAARSRAGRRRRAGCPRRCPPTRASPPALPALTTGRPAHDHARATNRSRLLWPRQRLRSRPPLHLARRAQTPTTHHNRTAPPRTPKLTGRQQPHTTTSVVRTSLSRSGGKTTRLMAVCLSGTAVFASFAGAALGWWLEAVFGVVVVE